MGANIDPARKAQTDNTAFDEFKKYHFKVDMLEAKFDGLICTELRETKGSFKARKIYGYGHVRTSRDFKDEYAFKFISNDEVGVRLYQYADYQVLMKNSEKYKQTYFLSKEVADKSIDDAIKAYLRFYVNRYDKFMTELNQRKN